MVELSVYGICPWALALIKLYLHLKAVWGGLYVEHFEKGLNTDQNIKITPENCCIFIVLLAFLSWNTQGGCEWGGEELKIVQMESRESLKQDGGSLDKLLPTC